MQPDENGWHATFAGLVVLRLIDTFASDPDRAAHTEAETIESAKRVALAIPQTNPARGILTRTLDGLQESNYLSPQIGKELFRYGRSLDLEGRWALASDVFQGISDSFAGSEHVELVIEASTALGAAARNVGDWPTSDSGYAKAQYMADSIGNRQLSLTVRVGAAASHRIRGNLPAAEAELTEVILEARLGKFRQVEALALHDLAAVAHARGDYQRAIHNAFASLELTTNPTARDRILADIAASYAGLGMKEAARDGYSIVALTSPHQWVRWQATLNLIELAVENEDEKAFDELIAQIQNAALDPQLSAYRLYYTGVGFRRFGRGNSSQMLKDAMTFASQNHFHQLAHEIETLVEAGAANRDDGPTSANLAKAESEELQHIAKALSRLRENAVAETS